MDNSDASFNQEEPPFKKNSPTTPENVELVGAAVPKKSLLAPYLTEQSWREALSKEFLKPYFIEMESTLEKLWREGKVIFPPKRQIFAALNVCPIDELSVVIIGQDPYHNIGQAHGLCFSVSPEVPTPPSLKNMFKELKTDIPGFEIPKHGCLIPWCKQGVLLLNASLTVEAHQANSHANIGWQTFTDACINHLNEKRSSLVFLLLGNFAQKKCRNIDTNRHCVIRCAHPSPLSVQRFWGNRIFSKCNDYLRKLGKREIQWQLPLLPEASWKTEIDCSKAETL